MEEDAIPGEISMEDLEASTKMSLPEEAPRESIQSGRGFSEINPKNYEVEGHFTGHQASPNVSVVVTSSGEQIVAPKTVWPKKKTEKAPPTIEEIIPVVKVEKPAPAAPRKIPATPEGLRNIAGNLIMDWVLAASNRSGMNLPQAVMLTEKQEKGVVLMVPVNESELCRVHPEDWVQIKSLIDEMQSKLLPPKEGLLFPDQVELHPDFAPIMLLQGL